jgi:hypothetical protein
MRKTCYIIQRDKMDLLRIKKIEEAHLGPAVLSA